MLKWTIQMKATEHYFPAVLFNTPYEVVLTFEFVYEILKCDHSNESCTGQRLPVTFEPAAPEQRNSYTNGKYKVDYLI